MKDDLLPYYDRELQFIRQMAGQFAEKYPSVAPGLSLRDGVCPDPHVERLIEAFALLCGRVHRKLDDEFPEIAGALLDALYPHYLRPVPSMAIAQFEFESSQSVAASVRVPAGTPVHSISGGAQPCSFRTCCDVSVLPLRVVEAELSQGNRFAAPAAVRIRLECLGGMRFDQIEADAIRFHLDGDAAAMHALCEMLFIHASRVAIRAVSRNAAPAAEMVLGPGALKPAGFEASENILPYSDRSFPGYRLLQEYFAFPRKFFFFDLCGLGSVSRGGFGAAFDIFIALDAKADTHKLSALEQALHAGVFQLGCTPIVNLFERFAEPIRLTQRMPEYRVIPDQHRQLGTEVYSIDEVASLGASAGDRRVYEPFYSHRHGANHDRPRRLWHAQRRASFRKGDEGSEVYLTLVDADFNPALPADEVLSVRLTCTNRDLAGRLRLTGAPGELDAEGAASLRVRGLGNPTAPNRPPARGELQWRLISHLSLNHLSIVEKGTDALKEILRLYDFTENAASTARIEGLAKVSSRPAVARVASETGVAFCRGIDVTLEFNEESYAGGEVYLFAAVLERFLGLYSAVNSFSRVTAATRKGVLKQWPPRAGEQILL